MRKFIVVMCSVLCIGVFGRAFALDCGVGYTEVAFPGISFPADGYRSMSWGGTANSSGTIDNVTLSNGWWAANWTTNNPTGLLIGESACYSTKGANDGALSSTNMSGVSTGKYCWCRARTWNGAELDALWVYNSMTLESNGICRSTCPMFCGSYLLNNNSATLNGLIASIQSTTCQFDSCPSGYHQMPGVSGPVCESNQCSVGTYHLSAPSTNATGRCPTTSNNTCRELGMTVPEGTSWRAVWGSGDSAQNAIGSASCALSLAADGSLIYGANNHLGQMNQHCYCKLVYWNEVPVVSSPWVYSGEYNTTSCPVYCDNWCSSHTATDSTFRSALFASWVCAQCPVASNFYTGSTGTTVPSVDNGNINSPADSPAVTSCYAKGSTTFHDETGVFTFSSNCNYSTQ